MQLYSLCIYLIKVLSIPEYNYAIGFAPLMDYNSQLLATHHYDNGQR
jgi:rRNA biogenesis protein RRP5